MRDAGRRASLFSDLHCLVAGSGTQRGDGVLQAGLLCSRSRRRRCTISRSNSSRSKTVTYFACSSYNCCCYSLSPLPLLLLSLLSLPLLRPLLRLLLLSAAAIATSTTNTRLPLLPLLLPGELSCELVDQRRATACTCRMQASQMEDRGGRRDSRRGLVVWEARGRPLALSS